MLCSASCCNEPPRHKESQCNEKAEEYSQKYAIGPPHQFAGNFVPTLGAKFLPLEPGGATQGPLDQRGHQGALFPAVRSLQQKPDVPLLPKVNASLHCEVHTVPPTLDDCVHAASQELLLQGY